MLPMHNRLYIVYGYKQMGGSTCPCKYLRKDDRCSIARVIFKLYCQSLKIDVNN